MVDAKDPTVEAVSSSGSSSGSCIVKRNTLAAVPEHQVSYHPARHGSGMQGMVRPVSVMYVLIEGRQTHALGRSSTLGTPSARNQIPISRDDIVGEMEKVSYRLRCPVRGGKNACGTLCFSTERVGGRRPSCFALGALGVFWLGGHDCD